MPECCKHPAKQLKVTLQGIEIAETIIRNDADFGRSIIRMSELPVCGGHMEKNPDFEIMIRRQCPLQSLLHDPLQLVPFLHDVFCQSELTSCPDEVVAGIVDLEVGIAGEVVIQEPGSELNGDREGRKDETAALIGCQRLSDGAE